MFILLNPRAESGKGAGDFRGCVHCVHHHDQFRCRWLRTCFDRFKRVQRLIYALVPEAASRGWVTGEWNVPTGCHQAQ